MIMTCSACASSKFTEVQQPNQQSYGHSTQSPAASYHVLPSAPPVSTSSCTSREPLSYEMALTYPCAPQNV